MTDPLGTTIDKKFRISLVAHGRTGVPLCAGTVEVPLQRRTMLEVYREVGSRVYLVTRCIFRDPRFRRL